MSARIYLDNAATSWPKPETVYDAVDQYQRLNGAPAGRSTYRQAIEARQLVDRTRLQLSQMINAPAGGHVLFASNGTDALNLCLHGWLRRGSHVVTTQLEHNSVLRPLAYLREHLEVEVEYVAPNPEGAVDVESIRERLRPSTRLVAVIHASNVTGAIQPIASIAEVCRAARVPLLVDAAQSLGHFPIDVGQLGIDMLAASGHKGLLGPLGTGIAYLAPDLVLEPIRQGGTGSFSEDERQPADAPDRFESGNLNVTGLAGLEAGVRFVREHLAEIHHNETQLSGRMLEGLHAIQEVTVCGPHAASGRVGVVSFVSDTYDVHELASLLDASAGIQVRAGLHCAPRVHQYLGSRAGHGTVRASLGPFNTSDDVDALLAMLRELHSH